MRQFDLVENPSAQSRRYAPYFVILQSHHLESLDSVILAPLLRDAQRAMSVLDIELDVSGERLVVALGELFSIERSLLKGSAGSIQSYEDTIRRGFDRIFTGF